MAAKENLVRKAPASAGEPSKSGQSDAESAGAAKEAPERAFAAATFDALKEASHDLKRRIEEKRSSRHGAAGQTDESPIAGAREQSDDPGHLPAKTDGRAKG